MTSRYASESASCGAPIASTEAPTSSSASVSPQATANSAGSTPGPGSSTVSGPATTARVNSARVLGLILRMALPQSDPQRDQRRRQHDDRELAPEQSALELLVVLIRVHARSPTA